MGPLGCVSCPKSFQHSAEKLLCLPVLPILNHDINHTRDQPFQYLPYYFHCTMIAPDLFNEPDHCCRSHYLPWGMKGIAGENLNTGSNVGTLAGIGVPLTCNELKAQPLIIKAEQPKGLHLTDCDIPQDVVFLRDLISYF
jgi:hypothetical protein